MPFMELSLGPTEGSSLVPLYSCISNSLYLLFVALEVASLPGERLSVHEVKKNDINNNDNNVVM